MHVKECPLFGLNEIWEISSHQQRILDKNLQRLLDQLFHFNPRTPRKCDSYSPRNFYLIIILDLPQQRKMEVFSRRDPKTAQYQVDPAEDERSRYVQKIDSKWVFTHL